MVWRSRAVCLTCRLKGRAAFGGFVVCYFIKPWGLRLALLSGTPLSFTLGGFSDYLGFLGIDEALQGVWLFVVQVCVLLGVGRGLSGSLWVLLCWGCSGVISRHAFASCAG